MKKNSKGMRVPVYAAVFFTVGMALWYAYKAYSVLWQ